MSDAGELFALQDDAASRPTFEVQLRGYDKRQVDRYVARTDSEISTLVGERDRAIAHIRDLEAQLHQVHAELTELRQRPAQVDRASFRHLGPMVDQILDLAEKQAETLTSAAAQRAADRQAEAQKVLLEAREHAAKTLRDLEAEHAARRAEHEKAHEERRNAAQAELAAIRELADKLRAEGEAAHERAQQEARRINEQSAAHMEQTRTEAEGILQTARAQMQQEVEAARAQLQQELAQWRANVEQEISDRRAAADKELADQRAAVEQELAQQRTLAGQKSAALHAQAQNYAAEIRRRADEQAAAHQQQLNQVQQEIQAQQQALAQLQAELEGAQQRLAQSQQEHAALDHEVGQLQQRLGEARQDLSAELARLEEARRAADSAERHAKEVRARVQREAKRVADLAAAAVMAAAASGGDTGEYRIIQSRAAADRTAGADARPSSGHDAEPAAPVEGDGLRLDTGSTPGHDDGTDRIRRDAGDNGHVRPEPPTADAGPDQAGAGYDGPDRAEPGHEHLWPVADAHGHAGHQAFDAVPVPRPPQVHPVVEAG